MKNSGCRIRDCRTMQQSCFLVGAVSQQGDFYNYVKVVALKYVVAITAVAVALECSCPSEPTEPLSSVAGYKQCTRSTHSRRRMVPPEPDQF